MQTAVNRPLLAIALALSLTGCTVNAATHSPLPAPNADVSRPAAAGHQTAVFAGGCFWGTQSVFEHVKGVVKVVYDPAQITYGELLRVFFSVAHDPTELNRQGPDQGTSYRSAIFYANDEQRRVAASYIQQLDNAHAFPHKIVTEVTPLKGFYAAEDYHQDYALHNPSNPYIFINDRPKVAALKEELPTLYVDYHGTK
jgi:peptide-methionine (S)-S-oxide reductase